MDSDKRLADLQLLIDEFKRSGLRELQVQHGDFEIYLSQDADAPGLGGTGGAPAVQVQRGAPVAAGPAATAVAAPALEPAGQDVPDGAVLSTTSASHGVSYCVKNGLILRLTVFRPTPEFSVGSNNSHALCGKNMGNKDGKAEHCPG